MIVETGDKVHIAYRPLFARQTQRHFIGEITEADGALCRILGYSIVYDIRAALYVRRQELRTTIVDLSESGYIVNLLDGDVDIEEIVYEKQDGVGLVATDGKGFMLELHEFEMVYRFEEHSV